MNKQIVLVAVLVGLSSSSVRSQTTSTGAIKIDNDIELNWAGNDPKSPTDEYQRQRSF